VAEFFEPDPQLRLGPTGAADDKRIKVGYESCVAGRQLGTIKATWRARLEWKAARRARHSRNRGLNPYIEMWRVASRCNFIAFAPMA
jgi:hypothetical protein